MSTTYDIGTLAQLRDGELPFDKVHAMMSGFEESDRFEKMLRLLAGQRTWTDPIIIRSASICSSCEKPTASG